MIREFNQEMISKYGLTQLVIAVEELSELQKELCKYIRKKKLGEELDLFSIEPIKEEIADVELMLSQLKQYFSLNQDDIYNIKKKKIERTKKRLK